MASLIGPADADIPHSQAGRPKLSKSRELELSTSKQASLRILISLLFSGCGMTSCLKPLP